MNICGYMSTLKGQFRWEERKVELLEKKTRKVRGQ